MPTRFEEIQRRYPDASKPTTWEEDFTYRVRTGGCDRAAANFANSRHPEDQRDPPPWEAMTGKPPAKRNSKSEAS